MASVINPAIASFRWSDTTPEQRSTLIAASLGWMLDAFDVMLYSVILTSVMQAFAMSKSTAGLLNALTLIASALGSVLFGLLADRFGRRRMLSCSILTYSIFTFACGFSNTVLVLAIFRFLLGFGMGGEWNCGATLVAETWPSVWRGRAIGIVQSGWAAGYGLAALTAGVIFSFGGWRWVFYAGLLPVLLVVWIQRRVPEPALWKDHMRERATTPAERGALWRASGTRMAALLAMNTFGMFAWWGLFSWLPAYLVLPATQGGRDFRMMGMTSLLAVLNLGGMLPGYLCFGFFADRFGRKRTTVAYLVIAAMMVPVFAAARGPAAVLVTGCVTAFFGTGFFAGSAILGSELFPTAIRAAALGVSYNVARGLSALAPWVIGSLGERRGLGWAFLACGVAFAAAAFCGLWVPETRGAELK